MPQTSPFIVYPDPRLRASAFARPLDAGLLATGKALLEAAEGHRAYGLAAVHIGQVEPLVVVSVAAPDERDYRLFYNPRIVEYGGESTIGAEGSVSLPGIEVEIARPQWARIGYDDADGVSRETTLEGFPARIALHEIEQMNGIFFLSHLSRLKRDAALRRFQKLVRAPN